MVTYRNLQLLTITSAIFSCSSNIQHHSTAAMKICSKTAIRSFWWRFTVTLRFHLNQNCMAHKFASPWPFKQYLVKTALLLGDAARILHGSHCKFGKQGLWRTKGHLLVGVGNQIWQIVFLGDTLCLAFLLLFFGLHSLPSIGPSSNGRIPLSTLCVWIFGSSPGKTVWHQSPTPMSHHPNEQKYKVRNEQKYKFSAQFAFTVLPWHVAAHPATRKRSNGQLYTRKFVSKSIRTIWNFRKKVWHFSAHSLGKIDSKKHDKFKAPPLRSQPKSPRNWHLFGWIRQHAVPSCCGEISLLRCHRYAVGIVGRSVRWRHPVTPG